MNYSNTPSRVRLDLFKESGKWIKTCEIHMYSLFHEELQHAVMQAMERCSVKLADGWIAVALDPYNQYAHPVCVRFDQYDRFLKGERRAWI